MHRYYVSKSALPDGSHEIHREDCKRLPLSDERLYLGKCGNWHGASVEARKTYTKASGCPACSPEM